MPGVMPKKKHSRSRKKGPWAHKALRPVALMECSQCHSAKLPHRVCPTCGYYNGREVVPVEEAVEE